MRLRCDAWWCSAVRPPSRSGLRVGAVGEPGGSARAGLDHDIEAGVEQRRHPVGGKGDAALPGRGLHAAVYVVGAGAAEA
jgi:hypothetical protein